eukprot:3145010-Ditylum_brightwellii.AAC.1
MTKLLLRNKLHLNQAWDTLCAKGPLRDYIRDCGLGSGCHNILEGLQIIDENTEQVNKFLPSQPALWSLQNYP